jgi:hypothetical protein
MHAKRSRLHPKENALTLVLRSTHSSQLKVGLLRFCFFLGGPSPCVKLVADGAGLVDGCGPSSSTVLPAMVARMLGPTIKQIN